MRNKLPVILAGAIVCLTGLAATEYSLSQQRQRHAEALRQQVTSVAGEVRAILDAELNASLHLTSGLIAYIQARQGRLQADEIEPWLSGLLQQGRHIRNIGLAPGNRITYIYPLKGNEGAIGLYYPDNPQQWPAVEQSIRERRALLAGPVKLMQGGTGLIHRIPVFLADRSYWGILSTVINADELFSLVDRMARERKLTVALVHDNGPGKPINVLMGDAATYDRALAQLKVNVPGSEWLLAAAPVDMVPPGGSQLGSRLFGWALSLTLSALVVLLLLANARRAAMLQDLAESRQRFTKAFETAPQGMALLDLQGNWLDANDFLCALLACPRDELLAHNMADMADPAMRSATAAALSRVLSSHARSEQWETRFISRSGEMIDCLCSMAYVEGQPSYLIAQIQDMREYKRLERMKSEFVSTVSHELRTPLTSITGALGLVTGGALGTLPQQLADLLVIAHKNSLRLGELINDLLDMEKLVAGRMTFKLLTQQLQPLIEDALASHTAYADGFGIRFMLAGTAPQRVHVDAMRLQQVLANYLSNAAKFSPAGSTVLIAASEDKGRVRVSVQDQGPGIPDEFRSRIFDKFSQADASDTRRKGGTGLGLAIAKELVERMGGTVGFESRAGAGSTFWFEFPCAAVAATV